MLRSWSGLIRAATCAAVTGALALAPASAGAATYNPALGQVVNTAADVTCSPVIVYASRGSSENLDVRYEKPAPGVTEANGAPLSKYFDGLGEQLRPFYTLLRDDYPAGHVSLVTNRAPQTSTVKGGGRDPGGPATGGYRAPGFLVTKIGMLPSYRDAVDEGVASAVLDLDTIHARCPDSTLVVAGYSEGAEVTRRALAQLTWSPAAGKAHVVLFGDVLWAPREPNVDYVGDTARDQKGAFRAAREGDVGIKSWWQSMERPMPGPWPAGWQVNTWCHGFDGACQWRPGVLIAHVTYDEEDAVGAAARMATKLGGPFARPVVSATINGVTQCYGSGRWLTVTLSMQGAKPGDPPVRIRGQWEPTSAEPFRSVTLTPEKPTVTVKFFTGLFPRLVIWQGKEKLDYLNWCTR